MLKNVSPGLIENVKDLKISLNELTVHDLSVYSMLEVYYKVAHKLNEVIRELSRFEGVLSDEVVKQNEKLVYLLGEGLENEVIKEIDHLIFKGFFDELLNVKMFSDLHNKIDNNKKEIYSELEHKANINQVRLKSVLTTLNDCDEEMLNAIQNKQGETSFNLTSIPKDCSVTFGKLDQDSIKNISNYEILEVELQQGYYDNNSNYNDLKVNSDYKSIKHSCYEGEMYNCDCKIDTEHLSTVIFYKEDGSQLSRLNSGVIGTHLNYKFTVPKGASYLTITSRKPQEPVLRKLRFKNVNKIEVLSQENKDNLFTLKEELNYNVIEKQDVIVEKITRDNTQLLNNKIYTSYGTFQDNELHSTLYYKLNKNALNVNLKGFNVGVYGGAFTDINKNWINSFGTDGSDLLTEIPKNAYYIALSVPNNNLYNRNLYITIQNNEIQFNKLNIDNLSHLFNNKNNQWKNKKILWMGTSVSFGQYATKSYVKEACDILECDFLNVSMPGLAIHINKDGSQKTYGSLVLSKDEYLQQGITIPSSPIPYTPGGSYNSYYRTYENVLNETNNDYDLYVFDVVPNNDNFDLSDWNAFNKDNWTYADGSDFAAHRTTFLGALLFLMNKLYEINPKARIVFVLGSEFSYSEGKEALKVISDKYRIGIIDIWSKVNLTPKSKMYIYTKDGTDAHPSTYAHEVMGKILANELLLVY